MASLASFSKGQIRRVNVSDKPLGQESRLLVSYPLLNIGHQGTELVLGHRFYKSLVQLSFSFSKNLGKVQLRNVNARLL